MTITGIHSDWGKEKQFNIYPHSNTDTEANRQVGRQADRQTGRGADRQANRQTDRHKDTEADRQAST